MARAELAVALAGRALDPNGEKEGGDTPLAAELLERALNQVARMLEVEGAATVDELVARFDDAVLLKAAGSRARAVDLAARISRASTGVVTVAELREAELFTSKLVSLARDRRRFDRRYRRGRVARLVIAMLVLIFAPYGLYRMFRHEPLWKASSAFTGYASEGELPSKASYGIFFHTNEETDPWLEIDLGVERDVSRVTVVNRFDCCGERAIPLVIQVRGDRGMYRDVARRTDRFDRWTATFPTEKARYVRLTVPGTAILHLRSVEVR